MSKSIFSRLQKLRTQIEASVPSPAIILLTSARPDDGATLAANNLADCLAAFGHRVALLSNTTERAANQRDQSPISLFLLSKELARGRVSDAVAALTEKMRREYDYTIIDGPLLTESSVAMLLASAAEAVLLVVRIGRSAGPEDESMTEALHLAEARVLGVIGVSETNIGKEGRIALSRAAASEPVPKKRPENTSSPIMTVP